MIDCVSQETWEKKRPQDYCYGNDLETEEDCAEYLAIAMYKACKYTVIKGIREHINMFEYYGCLYEDRSYYFIDLSFINLLRVIDAPDKFCGHTQRVRIRNMAIKYFLTKHLKGVTY